MFSAFDDCLLLRNRIFQFLALTYFGGVVLFSVLVLCVHVVVCLPIGFCFRVVNLFACYVRSGSMLHASAHGSTHYLGIMFSLKHHLVIEMALRNRQASCAALAAILIVDMSHLSPWK